MAAFVSRTLATKLRPALVGGGAGDGGAGSFTYLAKHWLPPSSSSSFSGSAGAAAAAVSSSSSSNSVSGTPPGADTAAPSSSAQSQEEGRGSRWSRWLLFVPGAITFGLGTWQIFRRQDKINMLEFRHKRLAMEPMKFNDITPTRENLDALEFRRVACKGTFDEKRSIYVGPRSRSISGVTENGYYLITPLMPIVNNPESVQSPILVNRGWVPRIWRDKALGAPQDSERPSNIAPQATIENVQRPWWSFWSKKPNATEDKIPSVTPVEVVGVVRGSEKPSIFVPENDPSSSQWFFVDVPAIARACGLAENTVYVEDINENVNPSCPYPIPKDVNSLIRSSVMPQDHLNYTLTWLKFDLVGNSVGSVRWPHMSHVLIMVKAAKARKVLMHYKCFRYSLSAAVTFMAFKRIRPKRSRGLVMSTR